MNTQGKQTEMESEAKVGQTEKRNEAMKKGQKERMKDGKLEKERKKAKSERRGLWKTQRSLWHFTVWNGLLVSSPSGSDEQLQAVYTLV